jgi:hypothetical protein
MSREELRKTGPLEDDLDTVISATFDVEGVENAAKSWKDAVEIMDRAGDAVLALDDLSAALKAWFERHPE